MAGKAYNGGFNTPLITFATFGGEIKPQAPDCVWKILSGSAFGLPNSIKLTVYSNGKAFIASCFVDPYYHFSAYDPLTKTWTETFSSKGELIYWGNGIFLFVYASMAYCSVDGVVWRYAGYLPSLTSYIVSGASDGKNALLSPFATRDPAYESHDIISSNDMWETQNSIRFSKATHHKGLYVVFDNYLPTGIHTSTDGHSWTKTLSQPYSRTYSQKMNFSYARSVHDRLFLKSGCYMSYTNTYAYEFCTMSNNAKRYQVNLVGGYEILGELSALIYCEKLGLYIYFCNGTLHTSPDGYTWTAHPQSGFGNPKLSAIYIPNDGFYVGMDYRRNENKSGYVLYAPYP